MNKNIEEAVSELVETIKQYKQHQIKYSCISSRTKLGYNRAILMIEQFGPEILESLLKSEDKDTSCPTCRDSIERFELINYPDTYMCDGCGLTRGGVIGKWNQVFKNLIWKQQGGEG